MTTHMTERYETAQIDAAAYKNNGRIDYRRKVQNKVNAEAAAERAKEELADAMAGFDYDRQVAAESEVRRTELALAGAVNDVEVARRRIDALDSHTSEFVADVIALHAYELGLHDANVVVMKYKPEGDEVPATKTLVIAQHEPTEIHGGGTMSGEAKMWTYGDASLDPAKARDVFAKYTQHSRGVEIGNWPGIFLKVQHVHAPEPIVTHPSAHGLAQMFANRGKTLNQRPGGYDAVRLWAVAPKDGEFTASAKGRQVIVTGQVAVGCQSKTVGYGISDIKDAMTEHMTHFGIGQFVPGVGILESVEVNDVALAEPGGVLISFTATGRRKTPTAS